MLVEFSVANFRSFKDKAILSFVASSLKSKKEYKYVDENSIVSTVNNIRLLKSAIVYGANNSGKSNLRKAILFMKSLVEDSAQRRGSTEKIAVEKYKFNTSSENEASFFEVICIIENVLYRYGFEIKDGWIGREWLYYTPKKRETLLFERSGDKFDYTKVFSQESAISRFTRRNALFLSTSAQLNTAIALKLVSWFNKIIDFSLEKLPKDIITPTVINAENISKLFYSIIKNFDLGFEKLDYVKKDGILREILGKSLTSEDEEQYGDKLFNSELLSVHRIYDENHDFVDFSAVNFDEYQSEGTKKLILLASTIAIYSHLHSILLIDELDSKLHPKLLLDLIKIINTRAFSRDAQFFMCTHNTILLKQSIFRRDQIWFTEKNRFGESVLYSLAEFKVRNDASFDKDYLEGRYGAIPFLNSQNFLTEFSK
jgi:uncharacterized protein